MLTTKNQAALGRVLLCALAAMLAGCGPSENRVLSRGERLVEAGQYAEAIAELGAATSAETNALSTNASAWNCLGLAYHHTGQAAKAERAYQRALKLNHDLVEAHYNLGCLWLELNRPDTAKAEFISYTSLRGKSVEGSLKLGTAQYRLREFDAAETSFQEVLALSAQEPEALNGLGLIQMQRNRPHEAAGRFEEALKQQPDYAPALWNLAVVSQHYLNNRSYALKKYRDYLALPARPANWEAARSAASRLEQELAANPQSTPPAVAARKTTPPPVTAKPEPVAADPKAKPDAPVVSQASPTVPTPSTVGAPAEPAENGSPGFFSRLNPFNWFRGDSASDSKQIGSDTNGAASGKPLAHYKYNSPAKPSIGDEAAAKRAFAQAQQAYQASRAAEAVQTYQRAIQLNPAYFEAHYNLGLAAAATGNLPLALTAYETALAIRPDSADARYNFAFALKQANYPADAANELERLLTLSPEDSRTHLALGNLYAQQLRQPARARQEYQKVLAIDPRNPQAAAIRQWLDDHPR